MAQTGTQAKAQAKTEPNKIFIELQRTLHGWGKMFEVIEVDHTDEVDDLIKQELAVRVKKTEVVTAPDGTQSTGAQGHDPTTE